MSQKPSAWSLQYEMSHTPWDLGRPHPETVARLAEDPALGTGRLGRVLVPGCGLGHDARALGEAGWEVTALDFAASLRARLEGQLGPRGSFVCADAFTYVPDNRFDLVFDHTFFCAIPPERRAELGETMSEWVAPNGWLISLVFPIGRDECLAGPPHAMEVSDLAGALGDRFVPFSDQPAAKDGRSWPTRWATFRRTPADPD